MEFKKIQFKNADSQKIYENYLKQIQSAIKKLNQEDQNDILMEMNSHIYESMSKNEDENDELKNLINTLDKIGIPNDVLKPLVAEKKLNQATKTFNPIHIFEALILNFSYGIIYFIFFILYLFLFSFVVLIFAKLFYPNNVGFFYKKGEIFQYGGFIENEKLQNYEILGNWFIPVTILLAILFYFLITLLLKLKKSMRKKKNVV
ncbi:HAAS domain-containing protein [Chryseobacterium sp. SC28]|jgi:uncharacterized membrane protein|uniref:HAAS domain-containing protein n=1 Tax=Chryseobacterium sp. SC28 TaxID=2268028 RepID=UPI000F64845F|nr:DUF1700 domain-containing protein [Chryseobacterium sp. SC28]RRQ45225.1 DUF1700 domain-containing protein [Chryseobacterium sp. SC28]